MSSSRILKTATHIEKDHKVEARGQTSDSHVMTSGGKDILLKNFLEKVKSENLLHNKSGGCIYSAPRVLGVTYALNGFSVYEEHIQYNLGT